MAASRLSRPGWKVLGGLGLAALLSFGAPPVLRRLDFFRIRQIEIRGIQNLEPERLVRDLGLGPDANLFDPLAPIVKRVRAVPGLLEATVRRRLPGTLVVTVREAPAVALVPQGERLRLVGEDGRVLPFDPTAAGPDLPVVRSADSLVTRLLARLRESDATFFGQVAEAERVGGDVVLTAGGRRFWFRPEAEARVFQAVQAVARDLERKGRSWAALDARFAGMVVVRWREA
ncbi:MAG TPA: FtsQ-type POTRA domain-containing protein [Gemmatimonadales bacterium]|nr:FtsQ-type POTRA domain-containing protein [Gemmatimonadales bacterium]